MVYLAWITKQQQINAFVLQARLAYCVHTWQARCQNQSPRVKGLNERLFKFSQEDEQPQPLKILLNLQNARYKLGISIFIHASIYCYTNTNIIIVNFSHNSTVRQLVQALRFQLPITYMSRLYCSLASQKQTSSPTLHSSMLGIRLYLRWQYFGGFLFFSGSTIPSGKRRTLPTLMQL